MINNKTKYALKSLLTLSADTSGKSVSISELAEKDHIPQKFLEAILLDLKHAGLIESRRGKMGGYMLSKPANQIKVGDIIRLFNGPLALLPCASVTRHQRCIECVDEATCSLRTLMRQVRDVTSQLLDNTSLADLNKTGCATLYNI
jgi:Rrf2 family protein